MPTVTSSSAQSTGQQGTSPTQPAFAPSTDSLPHAMTSSPPATGPATSRASAGVSGGPAESSGEQAEMTTDRISCDGWVDQVAAPDPKSHVLLDVVAFPVDVVETGREGAVGVPSEGLRFAKFGLTLRGDADIELRAESSPGARALMEWSPEELDAPASALLYGGCGASTEGWLAFPGGMWVSRPGCVRVVVHSGSRTATADVGVGRPCE